VKNHDSAHFAVNTSFYNPIFRIDYPEDDNERRDTVLEEIRKEIGIDPSPYSAVAYDILWIIANAENNTRYGNVTTNCNNINIKSSNDSDLADTYGTNIDELEDTFNEDRYIAILGEELIRSANAYHGITGNTTLNEMGDWEKAEYDIMAVRYLNDNNKTPFAWQKVDSYTGN
jgi:hypothetical protein